MDAVSYSKASSAYKLAGQAIVGLTTKADLTTSGILVPVGTTATRPTLGAGEAAIRYNTDVGGLEEWNGTAWKNVSADITAVAIKGTDTVANILAKTGMVAEDLWIASDTLDGYVYDGSTWINIGPLQGPQGTAGISAYQVALNNGFVGTELQWLASLVGPQGIQGITGNGIANVVKTSTVGLVDTYTITFTDTTTTTFDVTNGLYGANGVDGQAIDHVSKTSGTGTAGTTDTYTVWLDAGETVSAGTFNVYNGADGLGTGDMTKAVYDTTNNGVVDNAEKVNGLTVETAVPSGAVFTDTVYTHPDTDGSLHVPATGTTNSGKVLTAGATAGSMTWETPSLGVIDHGLLTGLSDDDHTQYHNDARGDARYLKLSGGTMTGAITSLKETSVAMSANAIDLATGNLFTKTITTATTLTVSNVPTSGTVQSFILELTNGGAYIITWFSGMKWAGGIAPTLTVSGVDILGFYSYDGGMTWNGIVMSKDSK